MNLKSLSLLLASLMIAFTGPGCSTTSESKPRKKEVKEEREERDDDESGYSHRRDYYPYGGYHRPGARRYYRPW